MMTAAMRFGSGTETAPVPTAPPGCLRRLDVPDLELEGHEKPAHRRARANHDQGLARGEGVWRFQRARTRSVVDEGGGYNPTM